MKSVKQCLFLILSLLISAAVFTQNLNDVSVWGNFQMYGPAPGWTNYPFRINDGSTDGGRFYVGSDGKVGIGTNAPAEKLTVNYSGTLLGLCQTNGSIKIGTKINAGAAYIGTYTNNPLNFITNNNSTPQMTINTNGNIGIGSINGTIYQSEKLTVSYTGTSLGLCQTDGSIKIGTKISGSNAFIGTSTSNPLNFMTNNNTRMFITADGNVGIGTIIPNEKLTVSHTGSSLGLCQTDANGTIKIGTKIYGGDALIGTSTAHPLNFMTNNSSPQMTIGTNGSVGIGTISENEKLLVNYVGSYMGLCQTDGQIKVGTKIFSNVAYIGTSTNHPLNFMTNNSIPQMTITTTGNVGIGTISPGNYKLAVEGILGAREIIVKTGTWADFVFDKNYKLKPLKEVEAFINTNKHLPGVPSEEQVKKDGINVGNMNAILLQKIEELTLYAIEQNKYAKELNKRMEAIEEENAWLKEKLNRQ